MPCLSSQCHARRNSVPALRSLAELGIGPEEAPGVAMIAVVRKLRNEWLVAARRGIRWSGTLVVGSGALSLCAFYFDWVWAVPSLLPFLFTGLNHLVAVWQLDRGVPVPECPQCRIALNVKNYKCGGCFKNF